MCLRVSLNRSAWLGFRPGRLSFWPHQTYSPPRDCNHLFSCFLQPDSKPLRNRPPSRGSDRSTLVHLDRNERDLDCPACTDYTTPTCPPANKLALLKSHDLLSDQDSTKRSPTVSRPDTSNATSSSSRRFMPMIFSSTANETNVPAPYSKSQR